MVPDGPLSISVAMYQAQLIFFQTNAMNLHAQIWSYCKIFHDRVDSYWNSWILLAKICRTLIVTARWMKENCLLILYILIV